MCTYLRSLNEVDNYGNCKSLNIVLSDLQESNKSLCELRKRFEKLEEYNITLDIAFQNHKEQMILNDPETKNNQFLVKTINNQSIEINDLKVPLQDKIHVINELKHQLAQLHGKSPVTQCESPNFDSRIQKIEDENVSLDFQVSSLVKEREHIKLEYKKLYDSIKQTRAKTKLQSDSLQQKLHDQISENNKLKEQLKIVKIVLWYLDSGCPKHMTRHRDKLINFVSKFIGTESYLCSACQMGKSKKESYPHKPEPSTNEKLQMLHMDLCGLMRVESINEKRYILVIVDDYSRFTWVKFLRKKDEAPEIIIKILMQAQVSLNATVRYLCTDNGTEFINHALRNYTEEVGISHNTSTAHTP
ncbi:retrovirus-related pol polyprotein from transposon TNT 1-94 [Tanacetum coccineum]|uniref:Retrovirus-related pol polyprotein from transposon TNT 1-94 n=1 Tax=Tanacetum coccineum TaxID=301880 RepID=A0ABQ4XXM7_9ASTR